MSGRGVWDVLVVGAGPAGLAAAARAAEAGRATALVDSNPAPGGQIWRRDVRASRDRTAGRGPAARQWIERARTAGVELLPGATVVDADGPTSLLARSPDGSLRLRAERLVLATGARELFLPFPGWTLPGVFGAGGLQALVKGGLDVRGKAVAVAGSGPLLLAVAQYLRQQGARLVALAEQAPFVRVAALATGLATYPTKLRQGLGLLWSLRGVRRRFATWPVRALAADGLLASVVLRAAGGAERTVAVDYLACGFGLVPETRLAAFLGCARRDGRVVVDDDQRTSLPEVFCAGEPTGIGGVEQALVEGEIAGLAAAGRAAESGPLKRRRHRYRRFAGALERAFALRAELRAPPADDTVVCRCEDVPWSRVRGARDLRDAKLKSRCGMGLCQGRVCGPALGVLCGWRSAAPRPPLFPVPVDHWLREAQTRDP